MRLIDQAFQWVRSCAFCYRLTFFIRVLLAAGFIPTGLVKLLGERFTLVSTEHPIGAFFEAMYQTGLYWRFLGLTQVLAGILLLVPSLAHLGAAMFLPIMLNIFLITISLSFGGTPIVTGLMLLAVAFLCLWDYHRFRPMLTSWPLERPIPTPRLDRWETVGFVVFAVCLVNFFAITRSFLSSEFSLFFLATGFAAGGVTLLRFLWVWWHQLRKAQPS